MGKTPFQTARDSTLTVLSDDYAEIDRDREAGLLSEKDGEAAKDDVRRAALQREAAEHKPSSVKPSVGVALGAAVAVTVLSLSLYAWFGEPGLVEVFAAEPEGGLMKTDGTLGVNARSISPEAFRLYLKKRPGDERAWVLYARECADAGNWQGAHDAYKAAVALNRFVAEDADVLMQYAAVTYNLKTSEATDEAIAILGRAETLDEKNLKGDACDVCSPGTSLDGGADGVGGTSLIDARGRTRAGVGRTGRGLCGGGRAARKQPLKLLEIFKNLHCTEDFSVKMFSTRLNESDDTER